MSQKAHNLIPTDHALQEKARLIVYGDNDPWNQTAADNSQWLDDHHQDEPFLDHVGLELLQLADAALLELAFSDYPVGLLSDHALDEVERVVPHDSVALLAVRAGCHGLDLHTLHHRLGNFLTVGDATESAVCEGAGRVHDVF